MRTPTEALQYIAEMAENHPAYNEGIASQIMRGDFSMALEIGGDEATFSEIAAVCRTAISLARIRQQLHRAEMEYDAAVNACHEAEGECRSSFHEHNQASYWKGRSDALRMFLPNAIVDLPDTAAQDSASKSNSLAVSG